MPLAPRFATKRTRSRRSRSSAAVGAPCTRRGRGPASRIPTQSTAPCGTKRGEVARDAAFERLVPRVDRAGRPRRARRGRRPPCSRPSGVAGVGRCPARLRVVPRDGGEQLRVDQDRRRRAVCRIGSRCSRSHDRRLGTGDQRLCGPRRRRRADLEHDLGPVAPEPGVVAEQPLACGERATRRPRHRDASPTAAPRAPASRGALASDSSASVRGAPQRTQRDHAAATCVCREEPVERGACRVAVGLASGGVRADRRGRRPAPPVDGAPSGTSGSSKRAVHVDRTGRVADARPRPRGSPVSRHAATSPAVAGTGGSRYARAYRAEELGLVDRLVGPGAAQRAAGGRRSARRAACATAMPRRRRAGTRRRRCRWCTRPRPARRSPSRAPARRTRAERSSRCTWTVDVAVACQRERQRGRPRAGDTHACRTPPRHERVDQRPRARERDVARGPSALTPCAPQHEAERHQQPGRRRAVRRADQHRDQVAPGGRAGPRPAAGSRADRTREPNSPHCVSPTRRIDDVRAARPHDREERADDQRP